MMRRKLARLLALALATSVMTLPTLGAQAHNGTHPDNSVYDLVETPLNWQAANAAARRLVAEGCKTAHLATITSQAEQNVVDALMAGVTDNNAWLGGHQGGLSLDENWLWITGEPFVYDNWGELEPNDTPFGTFIPGSEQHLETLRGSGDWNDAPGFETKFLVVESEHCG
jgi:hypothetical protein